MRPIGRNKMPPAAKKSSRGTATRQRIVEQSASVFNRHGYAGTSMAELMDATGLEKGGIYRHFGSKQELAAAAFDFAWTAVRESHQQGLETCPDAISKLTWMVRNFVELPQPLPGGCPLLNTAMDNDDGNLLLRDKAHAALAQWRSTIVEIVSQGLRDREFRPDVRPEDIATILIAGMEGAVMVARLEKSRSPLKTIGAHLHAYLETLKAS
jgi:TetR/AcrR family transcriptional regulator, transcriptional repressor for nem operon